jgi:4-amino-4-deoxy-L-arabinose transferase-like glycosyltransferase
MDETEQLVKAQFLLPGYGAQLPLYTWIQYLSFSLFGVNIFALSILKFTLLFSTYVCVMKVAQKAIQDEMGVTIATLSLFMIPQVAWESYRTLTNTVLATFIAALTLLLFIRLKDKPSFANYILFGATIGLGMLSKYNYAIFAVSLIAAGLATPVFRKTLLTRRSIPGLIAMLAVIVLPYAWVVSNIESAGSSSKKLKVLSGGTLLNDWLTGFGSLIKAVASYSALILLIFGTLFYMTRPVRDTCPDQDIHRLLTKTLVATFAVCSFLILFFKVTYFKERWLQPILFFLPIFFMYYLNSRIDRKRFRTLLAIALVLALLVPLIFSGGVLMVSKTGKASRLTPPYQAMAAHIRSEGFEGGTIIAKDHRVGGNFRLSFKDSTIRVVKIMELPVDKKDPALIIWNADKSETPPQNLATLTKELLEIDIEKYEARYVEKPMLYWKEKSMRLGYYIIKQE